MPQEAAGLRRFYHHKPAATLGIVLGGCCLALMYNVVLMQSVRTFSSVGTAVLGNFRTVRRICMPEPPSSPPRAPPSPHHPVMTWQVLLIFMSAMLLGELKDWNATRYIGCFNTFVGAAAYGLHPMLFGTPVTRVLPRSLVEEITDVRKDALADGGAAAEERDGLATPKAHEEEVEAEDIVP